MSSALSEMLEDLRIHRAADGGSLYPNPVARRRDVLAFAEMVIVDAKARFGRQGESNVQARGCGGARLRASDPRL
jgi:hypothetical protein